MVTGKCYSLPLDATRVVKRMKVKKGKGGEERKEEGKREKEEEEMVVVTGMTVFLGEPRK